VDRRPEDCGASGYFVVKRQPPCAKLAHIPVQNPYFSKLFPLRLLLMLSLPMIKYLLLSLFIVLCSFNASAQQFLLTGRVADLNGKGIGFAAVYIKNSTYGTNANEQGVYQLKLGPGTYDVGYRFVGYKEITERITITDRDVVHNVRMTDEAYALKKFAIIKGPISKVCKSW
jgi:hypothetical protein